MEGKLLDPEKRPSIAKVICFSGEAVQAAAARLIVQCTPTLQTLWPDFGFARHQSSRLALTRPDLSLSPSAVYWQTSMEP